MNLAVSGLILDMIGVFILTLTTMISPRHGRREDVKWYNNKRYWWIGWRPFYKNTKTLKWFFMLKHRPVVEGIIPPKHKLEIIGFLFITVGFFLQLLDIIK
ncbi:MAG TPA: hypothetical protein VJB35_00885 [Candidatus Nanoarchaeia archaeon]|nr:hypothetical protein [Candidatus Nanoarchaeia archaeon]